MKRRIAIFTGNRAEYGLLYPIIRAISENDRLELVLIAGGAHLDSGFGGTLSEIERDGFRVSHEVRFSYAGDDLVGTTKAIASGISQLSDVLVNIRPDWIVVYGDRFESFAAVLASTQMRIPTAHIEGGDYTEGGALDDSVRHAMTKLAHLHFATNEQAAERIRRLGEQDERVFTVGHPALDLIKAGEFASPAEICGFLKADASRPIVLFCQHSVTTEFESAISQIVPSLQALKRCVDDGFQVILTYPNNDAGGRAIIGELETFARSMAEKVQLHRSLGRYRFHGLLNFMGKMGRGAFVGNSSALIKETPVFGCPVVNIGTRQRGRLRGENVLDVEYSADEIYRAIRKAVLDDNFRKSCATGVNPYGAGRAGERIAEILANHPIDQSLLRKKMTY